jgi:DNA-binding FadR family transcriptional regulator
MLRSTSRPKIREIMAERLTTLIQSQGLQPGDRLPTEAELAAQFGVNRLSLREATKALEFLGVLESKPGRGLAVGTVDLARMAEYLGFHPPLQRASHTELLETRLIIETGVLPRVIDMLRLDVALYDSLASINERLRNTTDLDDRIALDMAFHRRLVECSGLTPLLTFNDLLTVFFQKFADSARNADWSAGADQHARLIHFLRAGDLTAACDQLRQHIQRHSQQIPTD